MLKLRVLGLVLVKGKLVGLDELLSRGRACHLHQDGEVFEIVNGIARKEHRRGKVHRSVLIMIFR